MKVIISNTDFDYQAKIFARASFQDSLSLIEKDLRD